MDEILAEAGPSSATITEVKATKPQRKAKTNIKTQKNPPASEGQQTFPDTTVKFQNIPRQQAYKSCLLPRNLARPLNSDSSVDFNLKPEANESKDYVQPGSEIRFQCKPGHFPISSRTQFTLTSVCQSDGVWSSVSDCQAHPCWDKVPRRPLNGRREVGVVFRIPSGDTRGSHVNFTCNPFYTLVGKDRVLCSNQTWDNEMPECRLNVKELCREKPPSVFNKALLKALHRIEIKYETSYMNYDVITHHVSATYVCPEGHRFRMQESRRQLPVIKNYNGQLLEHTNSTCVGENRWIDMPICEQ